MVFQGIIWARSTMIISCIACIALVIIVRAYYIKRERRLIIFNDEMDMNGTVEDIYADTSFQEYKTQINNILKLRAKIRRINRDQKIYNEYSFGSVSMRASIIVVQVHNKLDNLRYLLQSLRQVVGILRSFVIFAHDYYDEAIQQAIHDINFVRYTQIFYPYSSQLHPNIFPGDDPKYCTRNYHCEKSRARDASLAQQKHFWWWKMNHIFDYLETTKFRTEYIIFLDENQYVAEDLIYLLKFYIQRMPDYCPECDMICFGARLPSLSQYHLQKGPTVVEEFGTTHYHMGLAFNRTLWDTIKRMKGNFCYHNDFNWNNSLHFLGSKRPQGNFKMLSSLGPRVFEVEKCTLPYPETNCDIQDRMQEILLFLKLARKGLYPRVISLEKTEVTSAVKEYGGWGDERDHELCLFLASKMRDRFILE